MTNRMTITRVSLKNYKSIAACVVSLRPLMFFVGPNGAGKSNFLDALRFVTESLRTSLDHALRDRGGINEVRRRSSGHPTHFGVRLDFEFSAGASGHYYFRVGSRPSGGYEIQKEECCIRESTLAGPEHWFEVVDGVAKSSMKIFPLASADRLVLVSASGLSEFRPVYESLSQMGFYNLNPERIRDLQAPDLGQLLLRDGSNITSVLAQLSQRNPAMKTRIEEYLSKIVPGVRGVEVRVTGSKETLEFRQDVAGSDDPWRFPAANMSDGTLRALGILVALFQGGNGEGPRIPLVGVEEPEAALHPAAAGVLLDALREASRRTQVLVTSHSPDLLDDSRLDTDSIVAVAAHEGTTHLAPLDEAGRSVLKDSLYTAGELLRLNQLAPDPAGVTSATWKQLGFLGSRG
jgi:predicted ATPase